MTPSDRRAAIDAAIASLGWCNTIPHTTDRALAVLADTTRTAARIGASGSDRRTSKGSHSDPTGAAVARVSKAEATARETAREVQSAVALCAKLAAEVAASTGVLAGPIPTRTQHRIGYAIATLHRLDRSSLTHTSDGDLRHLAESAVWLGRRTRTLLAAAVQPPPEQVRQPKQLRCVSCARWAITAPVAGVGHRCEQCRAFTGNHRVLPTEAICREWHHHGDRARITPGMIAEAKAHAAARPRRRRTA